MLSYAQTRKVASGCPLWTLTEAATKLGIEVNQLRGLMRLAGAPRSSMTTSSGRKRYYDSKRLTEHVKAHWKPV